jgi:4-amino-4-deoxy-L-arabinose transferase-like glycosyltransferase
LRTALLKIWLLIVAIALFINIGGYPLFDADEGRNGEVGREMAATNDYVMPRIDGMPYLDKPVVYFAAEAAAMEVLGPTELAARLPAYLFTLLTALLVFWFARRVWSEESAYIAAIAFLSMPLTLAFARTVIFDSALTFFIVGAIVAFYMSCRWPVAGSQAPTPLATGHWPPATWSTIAWASIAFGVLTKGPVAIAVPLLVMIPYAIKWKSFRKLWSWGGLVAFVVIIAPWVWAVSRVVPDFLHYVLVTETVQRLATKALKRTGPPWYFIPYVIGGALPWSILACFAWGRAPHPAFGHPLPEGEGDVSRATIPSRGGRGCREAAREGRDHTTLLLALWILIPFLFFSISQSKRPQYILPVMPAIALAIANFWSPKAARIAAALFAIVGVVLVAAPFVHVKKMAPEVAAGVASSALPMGIVTLIGALAAIVFAKRREIAVAALSLPLIAVPITANPLLQSIGVRRSAKAFVSQLAPYANRQIVGIDDYTGSLQFYLRKPIVVVTPNAEEFTSNYIIRHYDQFANDPGSPVRRDTVYDAARLYIVRSNDAMHINLLQSNGFAEVARDAHHVALARIH